MRAAALLLLVVVAGCGRDLKATGTSIAATTSRLAPGATASIPPAVVVTSPAPGAWVVGPDVAVEGIARLPGRTISSVEVAGQPAALAPDGTFRTTIALPEPGLATVTVRARDTTGREHVTHASYVRGPFARGSAVPDAIRVELGAPLVAPANEVARTELAKLDFEALLTGLGALPVQVIKNVITAEVQFLRVDHGPPVTSIAFAAGGVDVAAEVPSVSIDVLVTDRNGLIQLHVPATVTARAVRATGHAALGISPVGSLAVTVAPLPLAIDDLRVQTQGAISSVLVTLLRQTIESTLEKELSKVVAKLLPPVIDQAIADACGPHRLTILGRDVDFGVRVKTIDARATGLSLVLDARVDAPGQLVEWPVRGGVTPILNSPARAVRLALSRDAIAHALAALWRSGALDVELRPGPGSAVPLDAASLAKLVPELEGRVPASASLVLRISPRCPPELRVGAGQTPFVLALGELRVEVLAVDSGVTRSLITVAAHGQLPVDATCAQGELSFKPAPIRPTLLFSVVEQPVVRVDEERLATRLTVLADAMLPRAFTAVAAIPLPSLLGRSFVDGEVSVAHPGFDHLVFGTNVK